MIMNIGRTQSSGTALLLLDLKTQQEL